MFRFCIMPRVEFTRDGLIELRGVKRKKMKSGPCRIFKWKMVTKTGMTQAGLGIDVLLDEIIRAQGRGQAQGSAGAHGRRPGLTPNQGTGKLIISNLDWAVSDTDIQALFGKLGDLQSAVLHHKKQGKSLHTAHGAFIIFN